MTSEHHNSTRADFALDEIRDCVDRIVAEIGGSRESILLLLQRLQDHYHYIPEPALRYLTEKTEITPAQAAGVVTFYNRFRLTPVGEHLIKVCHGTACHVAGAPEITKAVRGVLGLPEDEDTSADGVFTVTKVACLGCCSLAPVMQIDEVTYGRLTPGTVKDALNEFLERQAQTDVADGASPSKPAGPPVIFRVGIGSCCVASGSAGVREIMEREVRRTGAAAEVRPGGCIGMCHRVPMVEVVHPDGRTVYYGNVDPARARRIVRRHIRPRGLAGRLAAGIADAVDLIAGPEVTVPDEQTRLDLRRGDARLFLEKQRHVVLENAGQLDPIDLQEYTDAGGFEAARSAFTELTPEEIIAQVRQSGLRGRGGAGFPTAEKWQAARQTPAPRRYVVCNGDEGDPGAFMDRMILESYPFRVIEGMLIAARAVGATQGFLYVRSEYPLAVRHFTRAIEATRAAGYLGQSPFGIAFRFDIEVRRGAGAFVSGEETALIAAIEGRRGVPRFRPPYPAEKGLHAAPTVINNVETYACLPWILRRGPDAFAAMGTVASRGTKVFALAGRVRRGGLIEVPMGITIGEIVQEIGGGVRDGRQFKAVQVGGPSGGCIPARLADTPIDYEALLDAGAIMGSGGLVVLDDRTCMVDLARFFLRFTQDESCGQCTFCRIGTKRMLEILERLCNGEGKRDDIEHLEDLARKVRDGSLCGLGKTAPNPVLTTLRYFRGEYEAHINGTCPAGVCQALIAFRITDQCIGCTICAQNCPTDAIAPLPYQTHEIDQERCVRCGTCRRVCPEDAVSVE
ncbi:MAG: 4Fe-4S dicluster domain-containing protein [Kiritimatiellaeota bacterium]|nr:4Fe-4S dicluster domain-containing protein [Kiritimatiellota bacterium]